MALGGVATFGTAFAVSVVGCIPTPERHFFEVKLKAVCDNHSCVHVAPVVSTGKNFTTGHRHARRVNNVHAKIRASNREAIALNTASTVNAFMLGAGPSPLR